MVTKRWIKLRKHLRIFNDEHCQRYLYLPNPRQLGKREKSLRREGLGKSYIRIGFHTIPIDHEDLYALDVASYLLSHGRSSRLVKVIQEDKREVLSIYSYSYTPEYDAGVFGISASSEEENTDKALNSITKELFRLHRELVGPDELAKAKKQKIADDILGNQTAVAEASELGINIITTGNPDFNTIYLEQIQNVSAEDIQSVALKYFIEENMTVVTLRPKLNEETEQVEGVKYNNQSVHKITLKNGLRLLVKRNPNVPLVNIRSLFLGGVLYEPKGQAGISRITAELLTRGTKTRSRDEIARAFDGIGGFFESSSGNNTFGLTAEVLKEDFPIAFEIFSDSLLNPTFSEDEFLTVKNKAIVAIESRSDRWDSEIGQLFRQEFFDTHPYSNDSLGDRGSVNNLTTDHVREFYNDFADPKRGIITVFGDINVDDVVQRFKDIFENFDHNAEPLPTVLPKPLLNEDLVQTKFVKKQLSSVYIGFPGFRIVDTPDRFPMIVLDTIISGFGYPGGWLYEHLRGQDRDLVYVVHGFNFMGLDPGYFGVTAASSPDKMDEVIKIILEDIDTIRSRQVTAEELSKAKIICNTMEKLSRQTNSAMALQAAVDELYGLGYEFSDSYTKHINAVTPDEVFRVANKYLTNYVLVKAMPEDSSNQKE